MKITISPQAIHQFMVRTYPNAVTPADRLEALKAHMAWCFNDTAAMKDTRRKLEQMAYQLEK